MRGGRGGGRGRGGRGGGRGPVADLMRDTLEDIGMNAMGEPPGRGPPVLYPPIELNAPVSISEHDFFLIQKMRETANRIENSPYFISLKTEETDIVRYSDKYRKKGKELGLLECINTGISNSAQYIPAELLNGSVTGGRSALYTGDGDQLTRYHLKRKRDVDLQKLEQQETAGGEGKKGEKREGDSDGEGEEDMDNDEFEMDDDYGVDHYASGDDGGYDSGGDGGEAFF